MADIRRYQTIVRQQETRPRTKFEFQWQSPRPKENTIRAFKSAKFLVDDFKISTVLSFDQPLTEYEALNKIEEFLSEKYTKKYASDIGITYNPNIKIRGHALQDHYFLGPGSVDIDKNGQMTISCDS